MANLRPGQHAGSRRGLVDLPSYISGYVDGEGCFTVSISPRPTLRVGWEVRPSLSVSQNADRSDRTLKWEIRSLPRIVDRVIPHFRRWPLQSGKQEDFERFAAVCERMVARDHLHPIGLVEIVRLAAGMNPSGTRGYAPARILESLIEMKA